MKRKLTKIFGVGLSLVMVLSLMVAFAPVAVAADYEENDWGEWGLPDTEPDTDVGPIAVAPDGTLYAAVGTTSLASSGDGSASWSSDNALVGDYSVELIGGTQSGDDWAAVVIPMGGMIELADVTEFIYNYTFEYAGNWGPHICFYTHDPVDGETADISLYSGGTGPPAGTPADVGLNTVTVVPATSGFFWYGSETTIGGLTQGLPNMYTLDDFQTMGDFQYHVIDRIQIEYGWWSTGDANEPAYVDDVSLNGSAIGIEGAPKLVKSEDDGYTWDDTELDAASATIVDIAISPNYEEDETLYVGCIDGTVYRVEEAGEGDVIVIKDIVDKEGTTASALFSMDVWTDEDDYNWILVGTDLDVLVLQDKRFADWRDQELATGGDIWVAYEVAFAPDFEDSDIIWAVVDAAKNHPAGTNFMVTATASPGKWGQDIGEVDLGIDASPYVDIGFPDDYESDPDSGNTNLWVAVSSPDTGDIFLIEGVDAVDGNSNAISMFDDIGGEDPTDFNSIAVSGDYGDEIILAGELYLPTVWISDDGGYGWGDADKSPTGEGMTYVIMEADVVWGGEVFDPDDGMAFAATAGAESAVSRSNDGGLVYNQVGYIDTQLDGIHDIAFHPDFPDTATYLLITWDDPSHYNTDSLWLTENGDEDEPDYYRVLCGINAGSYGDLDGWFYMVEYSQDGDAIYITGNDDIWKSTDDGQTFGKHRTIKDNANINDWVITEDDTIYAAASDDGFYMTTNSGLSWTSVDVGTMNDICLSPDFENDETILLGGDGGEVFMSDDAGDSFDDTGLTALDGFVYVAFDADYADEDADGYTLIYAADNGVDDAIQVGEVSDTDDVAWDPLEDDTNEEPVTGDFYGLVVAEDNALYAIGDTTSYDYDVADPDDDIIWTVTGVVRLLLHESDSIWENADDGAVDPRNLWLSAGSNVLWTIDTDDAELWVLEDTLSGQVTLDSPPDGYQHDREDVIQLAWDEMRGADEYEVSGTESTGLADDIDEAEIDDTDIVVNTAGSAEYDWKVRVSPSEPWHSRWSDEWTFNTALGPAPWAPTLYTPGGEWQYSGLDVELMPAFSWESAKNADGYQFVLADNAEFASPLVDTKTPESAYNLDFELEYNTNYFWRVMAYDGSKAISRWSDVGAFTTMTEGVPAPSPAPPATVTQPAPAPVVLPMIIPPVLLWTIVGIGALLIIAVIVLIIRTRRAV